MHSILKIFRNSYRVKIIFFLIFYFSKINVTSAQQWSVDKANNYNAQLPWLVGCNFLPSTAVNQIEMWQAATWDAETIDKELAMAASIGFNTVRVYLHDLLYTHEREGFLMRVEEFIDICDKHGIRPLLVLFDDCHYSNPYIGEQPEPIPGTHNSGWLQSPGYYVTAAYERGTLDKETSRNLENYVKGILSYFDGDNRILAWDIYNEPGCTKVGKESLKLLSDTWDWAWEVRPSQPLTACVNGSPVKEARKINTEKSDIFTFHNYRGGDEFLEILENSIQLAKGRPVWCTEYMARTQGNTFEFCLPIFKEKKISAWSWGLVDGKSNTKWPWSSTYKNTGFIKPIPTIHPDSVPENPELWFHEVFRKDGTPYDKKEVELIKRMMKN